MTRNFPAVSAVLLLQRMLNLSASYTALLIMRDNEKAASFCEEIHTMLN